MIHSSALRDGRVYYLFHHGFIERDPVVASEDVKQFTEGEDEVSKSIKAQMDKLKVKMLKGDFLSIALKLKCPVLLIGMQEIARRLKAGGIKVLDLEVMRMFSRDPVKLGDKIKVKCIRSDDGFKGFLGDGSEVILKGRGLKSGKIVECTVVNIIDTPRARRIECEVKG